MENDTVNVGWPLKVLISLAWAALVWTILYPPWVVHVTVPGTHFSRELRFTGTYSWLLLPPDTPTAVPSGWDAISYATPDWEPLLLEWILIVVVVAGLVAVVRFGKMRGPAIALLLAGMALASERSWETGTLIEMQAHEDQHFARGNSSFLRSEDYTIEVGERVMIVRETLRFRSKPALVTVNETLKFSRKGSDVHFLDVNGKENHARIVRETGKGK